MSVAKEEWKQLGLGKKNLTIALDWMHQQFSDAPVLGSLINPAKSDASKIVSWDEKEVPYDLLVTVPTNMGDPMIERSGLGDELNYVPVDKHTLQSKAHDNIFVIGDATDVPTSKAGSVAHFDAS